VSFADNHPEEPIEKSHGWHGRNARSSPFRRSGRSTTSCGTSFSPFWTNWIRPVGPAEVASTLDAIVVDRPQPTEDTPQHLQGLRHSDRPHGRGPSPLCSPYSADRPGETRREKPQATSLAPMGYGTDAELDEQVSRDSDSIRQKSCNYLGLVQLCCGLLWYRRLHRLSLLR